MANFRTVVAWEEGASRFAVRRFMAVGTFFRTFCWDDFGFAEKCSGAL